MRIQRRYVEIELVRKFFFERNTCLMHLWRGELKMLIAVLNMLIEFYKTIFLFFCLMKVFNIFFSTLTIFFCLLHQNCFECEICGKTYSDLRSCQAHIRGVHLEARQMCKHCGKMFKRRCDLYQHERRHSEANVPCKVIAIYMVLLLFMQIVRY